MNIKALTAEFIGTFCLTFAVASSKATEFPVVTPFVAALCLAMFVYTIGGVSGCHINPAVTIGLTAIKKISVPDAVGYIIAQVVGACAAAALLNVSGSGGGALSVDNGEPYVMFAEALGMFFFTFGIAAAVFEKIPESMSGIVVGGSLLLGVVVAAHGSDGVLNPAVSVGVSSFAISWPYLAGPIVGSIVGFLAGSFVNGDPY